MNKKILLLLALIVSMLSFATASASATHTRPTPDMAGQVSSVHLTAYQASKRCVVSWDGHFTVIGATSADLETNTCNDTMQVRIECQVIITGQTYWVYSGETNQIEHEEGATCSGVDVGVIGQIQYPDGGTWHTIGVARASTCSINVRVTHGTNTTDADIDASCGEQVRAWELFAGNNNPQYGPWKTSGDSIAWRNTGNVPDTGGYQRMQSNGTVHTITTY